MNIKDKKIAVLHQLSQESEPISLSKLMDKLGIEYKEDQASFFEDVVEDFKEIDLSRIAGLGITPDQMNAWIIAQKI